jgi:acyl-CoA reductase-like NAD-dependent aldehyde dehydrogenase
VLRYSDIDEVIARANHTDFGLGGSVWSSDRDRAYEVAARINAGTVWVNKHLDLGPDTESRGAQGVYPSDDHQHGEMRTPARRLQL